MLSFTKQSELPNGANSFTDSKSDNSKLCLESTKSSFQVSYVGLQNIIATLKDIMLALVSIFFL